MEIILKTLVLKRNKIKCVGSSGNVRLNPIRGITISAFCPMFRLACGLETGCSSNQVGLLIGYKISSFRLILNVNEPSVI
jgi:hypothetical protein